MQRRADDYFFLAMALLILGIVFIGFAHSYYLAGMFQAKLPSLLVHIHGIAFSCWVLLLLVQIALVSSGRVQWHRRLGVFGGILAVAMVVLGVATLIGAVRRDAKLGMSLESLLADDLLQLTVFAALVLWAFLVRTDGAAHKRLMIFATVALLGPALGRWPVPFVFSSNFVFFGILDSFFVFMIVFDLWTRRTVHRATIFGSLVILAMDIVMPPLAHLAWWHRLALWIQAF
jgi:hypothetical protein